MTDEDIGRVLSGIALMSDADIQERYGADRATELRRRKIDEEKGARYLP